MYIAAKKHTDYNNVFHKLVEWKSPNQVTL